jgi:hypothetical protein
MAVRYNGLNVVNGNPTDNTIGQIGDLATLLTWNQTDVSDDFEMNRNNYIYTWQQNRNPFIDYPLLADYIWGTHAGEVWHFSLSNDSVVFNDLSVYPNPTNNRTITVSTQTELDSIQVISINGQVVVDVKNPVKYNNSYILEDLPKGFYFLQLSANNQLTTKKIIVN